MRIACAALSATLLSGCAGVFAPAVPPAPVPPNWPADVAAIAGPSPPNYSGGDTADDAASAAPSWRAFFAEPALQATIALALANSRDARLAAARLLEARAQAGLSGAALRPTLDATAQRNVQHQPDGLGNRDQGGTSQRYDVGLGANWELDFWGRLAALDAAARAAVLASTEAQRAVRLSLIGNVAAATYDYVDLLAREALLGRVQANRAQRRDLVRARRDVGLAGDIELHVAEVAVHSAQADALVARRNRANGENLLRLLCGAEPDWAALHAALGAIEPAPAGAGEASTILPPLPEYPALPVGLPSDVLLRRPDVAAAEQRLTAAQANVDAARAAFFPRISLTAGAGTASDALSGLFAAGSNTWNFVPLLRLPLFDAGKREAEHDLAKAREIAAVADYEQVVQTAFREVADALAVLAWGGPATVAAHRAAQAQLARLPLVDARVAAGVANRIEQLDAHHDALLAHLAQRSARRQIHLAAVNAWRVVGGL